MDREIDNLTNKTALLFLFLIGLVYAGFCEFTAGFRGVHTYKRPNSFDTSIFPMYKGAV